MRKSFSLLVLILFVIGVFSGSSLLAQELREEQSTQQSEEASARQAALRTAASQYEIIDVLLAEGRFSDTIVEFAIIAELGLRGSDEVLLAQAAWDIAVRLREEGQFEMAHQIVDNALAVVTGSEGRYSLLMMRGKLFKDQHRYSEAIQALREAQQLGLPPSLNPSPDSSKQKRIPQ